VEVNTLVLEIGRVPRKVHDMNLVPLTYELGGERRILTPDPPRVARERRELTCDETESHF
jgi:hypothetical protein